jgi:hypothetical protein
MLTVNTGSVSFINDKERALFVTQFAQSAKWRDIAIHRVQRLNGYKDIPAPLANLLFKILKIVMPKGVRSRAAQPNTVAHRSVDILVINYGVMPRPDRAQEPEVRLIAGTKK